MLPIVDKSVYFLCLAMSVIVSSRQIHLFESTEFVNKDKILSGLHLISQQDKLTVSRFDGFAMCGRINFRQLVDSRSKFSRIRSDQEWNLFGLGVEYTTSFLSFGNYGEGTRSAPSWILAEVAKPEEFKVWSTNRWHSLCFSFRASGKHASFVKVTKKRFSSLV